MKNWQIALFLVFLLLHVGIVTWLFALATTCPPSAYP